MQSGGGGGGGGPGRNPVGRAASTSSAAASPSSSSSAVSTPHLGFDPIQQQQQQSRQVMVSIGMSQCVVDYISLAIGEKEIFFFFFLGQMKLVSGIR